MPLDTILFTASLDLPKEEEWHSPHLTEFLLCPNSKVFDLQSSRATAAQIYQASHLCNIICLYTHKHGCRVPACSCAGLLNRHLQYQ